MPASVAGLARSGNEVAIESDAGLAAGFADSDYEADEVEEFLRPLPKSPRAPETVDEELTQPAPADE